jgi:hypothetical protein
MEEALLFYELAIKRLAFLLPQEADPLPFGGVVLLYVLGETSVPAAGLLPIPAPKGTGLRSKFLLSAGLVRAVNVI